MGGAGLAPVRRGPQRADRLGATWPPGEVGSARAAAAVRGRQGHGHQSAAAAPERRNVMGVPAARGLTPAATIPGQIMFLMEVSFLRFSTVEEGENSARGWALRSAPTAKPRGRRRRRARRSAAQTGTAVGDMWRVSAWSERDARRTGGPPHRSRVDERSPPVELRHERVGAGASGARRGAHGRARGGRGRA